MSISMRKCKNTNKNYRKNTKIYKKHSLTIEEHLQYNLTNQKKNNIKTSKQEINSAY